MVIDLIDNFPLNNKQGPIYETTEVCVQLFVAGTTPIACSAEKTRLHELLEEHQ